MVDDFSATQIDRSSFASTDQNFSRKPLVLYLEHYWVKHITQPIRFRVQQTPSVLDLIFSNSAHAVVQVDSPPILRKYLLYSPL